MAENAEVKTVFTSDTSPLEAGAQRAKATISGVQAQEAAPKLGGGLNESIRESTNWLSALRQGVSRLLIPVALTEGLTRTVSNLKQATEEADRFYEKLRAIADTQRDILQQQILSNRELSTQARSMAELSIERQKALDAVSKGLDAQLDALETKVSGLMGRLSVAVADLISGKDTREEIVRRAQQVADEVVDAFREREKQLKVTIERDLEDLKEKMRVDVFAEFRRGLGVEKLAVDIKQLGTIMQAFANAYRTGSRGGP